MGYYFPKARTTANLNPEQNERYQALRSEGAKLPPALQRRLLDIKERIDPVTSGEIMSAFDELWQDAVVCWILSGENPDIQWIDLQTEEEEPTEEDRQRAKDWWEHFSGELKESEEQRERYFNEWERKTYPVRTFFRDLFARFRKSP